MPKGKKAKKADEDSSHQPDEQSLSTEQSESDPRVDPEDDVTLTKLRRRRSTSQTTSETPPQRRSTRATTKNKLVGSPTGDSDDTLYCFCRKPYDNRFMLQCEKCFEWYHGDCVGISCRQGKQMEKRNESYYCLACKEIPTMNKEENADDDEEDEESISLAAIRKQTAVKAGDETQSSDQKSEILESDEVKNETTSEMSHQSATSETKVEDFATLMQAERLLASISQETESPLDEDAKNKEQAETAVPEVKEEKRVRKKRHPSADHETSKESALNNTSSIPPNPLQQAAAPPPKKAKDSSAERCFVGECKNRPVAGSIYCSPDCVRAHCAQSVELLRMSQARLPGKSTSTDTQTGELRLSVIDAKSGRLINDHKLVNEKTIEKFITRHPTFRIVTPQATPSMLAPQQPTTSSSALAAVAAAASSPGVVNAFRLTVRQELRDALKLRAESAEDLIISASEISRTALRIEEALFKLLGGSQSEKYKHRFRSLILNIKDPKNKGLFRRILLSAVSPEELATAPPERLASEELVQWREQQRKKSLDLLISGETKPAMPELPSVAAKPTVTSAPTGASLSNPTTTSGHPTLTHHDLSTLDESFRIDTTANHRSHLFDVNCKLCTGKNEKVESTVPTRPQPPAAQTSRVLPSAYSALANETYANVAATVPIQISVRQPASALPPPPTSTTTTTTTPITSSRTAEPVITQSQFTSLPTSTVSAKPILSKSPAPSTTPIYPEKSPRSQPASSPPRPQLDVEWFGQLKPDVTASSVPISGRLISVTSFVHLEQFPETLEVIGKLATPAVWDYLDKIRRSNNKEIVVVLLESPKTAESITHYRATLASLKERTRYAVVRTIQAQIAGAFKDIYLTYTNTEWLRRLTSFGVKFTEQLPLESKLACILVRYLTAPVSLPPPPQQQQVVAAPPNVIPLDKKASSTPTQKEAETPRIDAETPKGPVDDDEDDDDYDPGDFVFPAKAEAPKLPEPSIYVVKPVQQSPVSAGGDKPVTTTEPEKKPTIPPAILSTPEEVSSVSELIRRILGGSAAAVNSPVATSTAVTAATTTTMTAVESTVTQSAQSEKMDKTAPAVITPSASGLAQPPALPPFPPPPPGFFPPPFPPFPGQFPDPSVLITPQSFPKKPEIIPDNMHVPPPVVQPPPQPSPSIIPPPPPGFIPTIGAPPFPPPPLFVPPPAAPIAQPPVEQFPPSNNHFVPPPPFPPRSDMHQVNEAERQIYRYLNQLLDETLSLQTRTSLLQELASLLQNPDNEDIVRQSPELSARFQKAVEIVNSVVERNNNPVNRPSSLGFGEGPYNEEPNHFPSRKGLLPTPNCPPLFPPRQPSPTEEDFIRPSAFSKNNLPFDSTDRPPNLLFDSAPPPLGMNQFQGPPFHIATEKPLPLPLFKPTIRKAMSDWRLLLRAYRDRFKQGGSFLSLSESSKSLLSSKASRSSESATSMGHRNKKPFESELERSRPSRWEIDDDQQPSEHQDQSSYKRGRHGSDQKSGTRRHSYHDDNGNEGSKRSRLQRERDVARESRQSDSNNGYDRDDDSHKRSSETHRLPSPGDVEPVARNPTDDQQDSRNRQKRRSRWETEFSTVKSDNSDPDLAEIGPPVVPLTITMPPKSSPMDDRRSEQSPRNLGKDESQRFGQDVGIPVPPGSCGFPNYNAMEQPLWRPGRLEAMRGSYRPPCPGPIAEPPFPLFGDGNRPAFDSAREGPYGRGRPLPPMTRTINNDYRGRGGRGKGDSWGPQRHPRGNFVPRSHFPPPDFSSYGPPPFGPRY